MARHVNQRALTVNTARPNPMAVAAPKPVQTPAKKPVMDDIGEHDFNPYSGSSARLGTNFHLLISGQCRAGAHLN